MSEMIGKWPVNSVQNVDLFTLCDALPDASVDLILTDLPYGTTALAWDTVIPFAPMWERFKRVIKPRGAIVLTASQPFTSALVMSNPMMFRYEWVWDKELGAGFLDAKSKPLKQHESVLVFSLDADTYYNPQFGEGVPYFASGSYQQSPVYGKRQRHSSSSDGRRYPKSILRFKSVALQGNNYTRISLHPNQKPVALFRYLIRTYTQPGELVLDPCVGSGTTAIAAREEQRQFMCGDSDAGYVEIARQRLAEPYTLPLFAQEPQP